MNPGRMIGVAIRKTGVSPMSNSQSESLQTCSPSLLAFFGYRPTNAVGLQSLFYSDATHLSGVGNCDSRRVLDES